MLPEERVQYLQELKQEAKLDEKDPKDRLLMALCDAVSSLTQQVSALAEVTDEVNDTLESFLIQLDMLEEEEDYFEGSDIPLYNVSCPQCGESFAVDEKTLEKGFSCPTCGEKLIQAE